jgi:hypothetical protein
MSYLQAHVFLFQQPETVYHIQGSSGSLGGQCVLCFSATLEPWCSVRALLLSRIMRTVFFFQPLEGPTRLWMLHWAVPCQRTVAFEQAKLGAVLPFLCF